MEIFSCGRCFNGEKAGVWQVLLLVCKSVNVCTSGHWPWWRLLTLGPDSGWSSWYWSRGEIRDSGWDGEPLWSFVPALWGVSQHPRMFSSWDSMMLSLIHRAGPRRLIGRRAGPAPYRELDYNWWEFDNNNLLYIYTMCHRNSMGYRHFKSAPSDAAWPIMWFAHVSPQQILIFVVIFIAKHFFQFHASQQSFRQKTIVRR